MSDRAEQAAKERYVDDLYTGDAPLRRKCFVAGWNAAIEADQVRTVEELVALPPQTLVFYAGYYDGIWATVAIKGHDGKWYDAYDPMADTHELKVELQLPVKIIARPEDEIV